MNHSSSYQTYPEKYVKQSESVSTLSHNPIFYQFTKMGIDYQIDPLFQMRETIEQAIPPILPELYTGI